MNKNSNRSRRKAAFAAALVFISNYCFAFPLSDMAASSVYADVAGETGGDKPNDTVVTTTSAANTTTQTTTAKTTTATKASTTASTTVLTTTAANSTTTTSVSGSSDVTNTTAAETTVTETTTTLPEFEYYTLSIGNYSQAKKEELEGLADKLFGSECKEKTQDTNGLKVKVNYGAKPATGNIDIDKKRYVPSESTSGNKLVYDVSYKVEGVLSSYRLEYTGLHTDSYYERGAKISIAPTVDFTIDGGTDKITITVDESVNISEENHKSENLDLVIKKAGREVSRYAVALREVKIQLDSTLKYQDKEEWESHGIRQQPWKYLSSINLDVTDKKLIVVTNGKSVSKVYNVSGNVFNLDVVAKDTAFDHISGDTLKISSVNSFVKASVYFNGEDGEKGNFQITVDRKNESDTDDASCNIKIPYLYGDNYYLSSYTLEGGKEVLVDYGTLIADLEKHVSYITVDHNKQLNIKLVYSEFKDGEKYDLAPSKAASLRNGSCYAVTGVGLTYPLVNFDKKYYGGSALYYVYYNGSFVPSVSYMPITETDNQIQLNDDTIKFVIIKNVLNAASESVLKDNICLYFDKKAPVISNVESSSNWVRSDKGSTFSFDVSDNEDCPIKTASPSSFEEQEIKQIYDEFINNESKNKQEIKSIVVGNYRFDRPAGGWDSASSISGVFETEGMRQSVLEYSDELAALPISEYDPEFESSYDYYRDILTDTSKCNALIDRMETGFTNSIMSVEEQINAADNELINKTNDINSKIESVSASDAFEASEIEVQVQILRSDLAAIESETESKIASLKKDLDTLHNKRNNLINDILGVRSEYQKVASSTENTAAKAATDYTASVSFDSNTGKFSVKVTPKDTKSVIDEKIKFYALDNSNNASGSNEVHIRVDGYSPTIDKTTNDEDEEMSRIWIEDYAIQNSSGDYVIDSNSKIYASFTEKGSGIDKVYVYLDGSSYFSKGSDKDGKIEMSATGTAGKYAYNVRSEDFSGRNIKVPVNVFAYDNVGNGSDGSAVSESERNTNVSSDFNIIVDSASPEIGLQLSATPDYSEMSGSLEKKWFDSYEKAKLVIKAADVNPEIASGIKELGISINDSRQVFSLADMGISEADLASGEYYIGFEKAADTNKFKAYLMKGDAVVAELGEYERRTGTYFEGSTEISKVGSVKVMVDVCDYAGNPSSGETTERFYVDLDDPTASRITVLNNDIKNNLNILKYAFFAQNDTQVIVEVEDDEPSSGINGINVKLLNADGTDFMTDVPNTRIDAKKWSVNIPVNFKGTMQVTAVDNVGRPSDEAVTFGIITENGEKHSATSSMSIELPETQYTDRDGKPLYNADIIAKLKVKDTFSDIASVYTAVSGIGEKNVYVNDNGDLWGDEAEQWHITDDVKDVNLVPEISREVNVTENANGNKISMRLTDNAGNPDDMETSVKEFSIDKTVPVLDVVFSDINGSADQQYKNIYKNSRKAVITVTERNFDAAKTDIMINGVRQNLTWTHVNGKEGTDEAQYQTEVVFENDGTYQLTAKCRDMGDLESNEYKSDAFTIDRTAPKLNSGFDADPSNEKYYNKAVSATFTVDDDNFDPNRIVVSGTFNGKTDGFPKLSDWTKNGSSYTATIRFSEDGEYDVNISGSDMAGNSVDPFNKKFTIDKKAPNVEFSGVKPANNGAEIRPHITFTDTNLDKDSISVTMKGAKRGNDLEVKGQLNEIDGGYEYIFDNIPNEEEYDDIYTISASVKDKSGNKFGSEHTFSVNRYGSTFVFDEETGKIAGKFITEEKDIVIKEYNVDKHSAPYSVIITQDGVIKELKDNTDFKVEYSGGDKEWSCYTYTIPKKHFAQDARYTISVHSFDEAGNTNISDSEKKKAELSFCVDKTAPLCIPLNIADNGAYKGTSHQVRLSVSDNIELKESIVYIDDEKIPSSIEGDECVFELPNAKHTQDIRVVLVDMADNKIEYAYKNILVSTNVVRLAAHKTWVKVTAAGVVVLGGAAAFLIRRKKRSRS